MHNLYGRKLIARAFAGTAIAATASALATPAMAQQASVEVNLDVAAGSLAGALNAFANATGYQLLYPSELVQGKSTAGVRGRMSVTEGLGRVLAGTGLTFRVLDGRTIQISTAADAADGEKVTGAVRVEGAQGSPYFGGAGQAAGVNGTNGSRDITATEGTKSFTSGALTIGSKVPQALKDVPQSISVVTSERLIQQNVTDFTTAMKQLPGITLVQNGTSLDNQFYSRGFIIQSIQVDGGAPLTTSGVGQPSFFPQIDMSIYDHVELLRGAAGLFNGYGSPSGTVNLVRKKPLDHPQFSLEAQAGSWSAYRVVADASSPLAMEGKLRGRLVITYQNNHYFYNTAKDNKTLIYGVAEMDMTPTTLLTAGINYTKQDSVPWYLGLPRYLNGEDLKLPRSTSFVFPWNRWNFDTTEIFGSIEQKIGRDWALKLNLTNNRQTSTRKIGYSTGAVNPTNGLGPRLAGTYGDYASTQLSAEATLTGAFTLFGQRQELTLGANRVDTDGSGLIGYASLISGSSTNPYQPYPGGPVYCSTSSGCPVGSIRLAGPPIDVFNFDPNSPLYTEPRNSLPSIRYTENGQIQSGAYINLRLTAFDRLHLTTGLRWSRYESKLATQSLCTTTTGACAGRLIGDVFSTASTPYSGENISWPPPINLSFDVTKSLTVYAGYTDIYQSQAFYLRADGTALDPVTGSNWEGGVKWAARSGKLNLSLAAYRIRQNGFGTPVGAPSETFPGSGITCCWMADPNRTYESKGIDLEMTGELRPGWQVSASYVFDENEYEGSSFGTLVGTPFVSIQPKDRKSVV